LNDLRPNQLRDKSYKSGQRYQPRPF
jgi:hypothetical protein